MLSQYLVNRDANRGECAQPCRWGYHLMEEKRTNEFYPVFEDEKGTYILNAKDMCMLNHIDKLAEAGVNSFKIEGRAKSSYYVSATEHTVQDFSLVTQRKASITKTVGIFVNMMLWLWLTVVAVEEYTVLKKTNSTRATRLKCFHLLVAL